MSDVIAKQVHNHEHLKNPGEYMFTGRLKHPGIHGMIMCCPCGCGDNSGIDFDTSPGVTLPFWKWDGNEDAPTLSPSLQKTGKCRWHGHLVKGVFVPC